MFTMKTRITTYAFSASLITLAISILSSSEVSLFISNLEADYAGIATGIVGLIIAVLKFISDRQVK